LTSERLSQILAPVRKELHSCKGIFSQMLSEHDRQSGLVSRRVPLPPDPGAADRSVSVPLVADMASRLRKMEGKWIRGALVLLAGRLTGCRREDAIKVAAALELIHLATLVHDDIIDGAETRRGFPSLPRTHGEAVSVLMGDLIYAKAMRLLIKVGHTRVLEMVGETVEEVCLGEISEHQFSWDSPPSESDYMGVIRRKTARLMECCARSGCLLSNENGELVDHFGEFGLNLGMAFQITDDILDITGDGHALGKDPGTDLRNGNITLPLIHLASLYGNTSMQALITVDDGSDGKLSRLLEQSGSLDYARTKAREFAARAEESLAPIEKVANPSEELESLRALARLVVSREY
jgi:geranylgeranyl pyrophosphate synthase